MNIKEHIEAGHYGSPVPGAALVPTADGRFATVAKDLCKNGRIIGWLDDWNLGCTWTDTGTMVTNGITGRSGVGPDLLPPKPRTRKVTLWARMGRGGEVDNATWSESMARNWTAFGHLVVTTVGEYEEPWT